MVIVGSGIGKTLGADDFDGGEGSVAVVNIDVPAPALKKQNGQNRLERLPARKKKTI
jgi:hypothetical protein